MDINATIIGQFITFAILIWFTMKYVWPPIMKTMEDREAKIAAGIEAAERSKRELEMAEHRALNIIREAKQQATQLIDHATLESSKLIEAAKAEAKTESQRIIDMAQIEIDRSITSAKEALKEQLAHLAISGAEKIIQHKLDPAIHHTLLDGLVAEI